MSSPKQEDIAALESIAQRKDIDMIPYNNIQYALIEFISSSLLNNSQKNTELNDSISTLVDELLIQARAFLNNKISVQELAQLRIQTWKIYDTLEDNSAEKKMIRIVIITLYDEETAEFATYGATLFLENIFTSLLDFGDGFCQKFVRYSRWYF
ncbi:hypothetical protein EHW65_04600 [Erwinia psidii]|uniref:hypothetical protein n=1 Tax=Erwinia psidii TaxID=69224 RepID=UPI00226AFE89|nr:hypothetical protein [Erwinia psidii]MCX8956585.1 hypothetical protein [Erwinia psidii]